ncbi:putative chloride channel, voltage gated [Medicago truncatula]|uniref:Chloride channel protein n=1 Tax=Medicago truncatula TaxID=3880 RepID=G7KFH2_MEDTR|nr:chloride channel protein CLC-e [Medicago truncatula]AET01089.1 ClC chloride channel family protein [Medicago truncatula]RHN58219.1 putative chloride channel, voltage gated [Medicago truncatula]
MGGLGCAVGIGVRVEPNSWHYHHHLKAITVTRSGFPSSSSYSSYSNFTTTRRFRVPPHNNSQNREGDVEEGVSSSSSSSEWIRNSGIISSCLVGLLTGVAVVLFNNVVHEIRDLLWDGIPDRGASWLREAPIQETWKSVILVPAFGGLLVSLLNLLSNSNSNSRPFLKAIAASITLGTGNSLGPEGPSVDIGNSIARWIASTPLFTSAKLLPLRAAGSAAGLSAGFNAAVAGCFFAVESVLWPSDSDSSNLSLTNTTSTVILSAVIASVISEIGLGSEPAFQVPDYDFRSPAELPLYLLLGILCGLVSLTLSWSTSYMFTLFDNLHKATGMPKASFPILGGLSVGLIALLYPEILYWGFENVDILLESRPFVKGLSTDLLLQLIAVKIVTTSLCRASGLVGGYYAPSLFIGGATGMAYGKLIAYAVAHSNPVINLSVLEVASPQAYGLVGMAATLAGVCQVPLTAVLLLFELTQDYRIVLPLLGAVGLSSWISSVQTKRGDERDREKLKTQNSNSSSFPEISSCSSIELSTGNTSAEGMSYLSKSCQVESSSSVEDNNDETMNYVRRTLVSEAMKTRYVTVSMCTPLTKVIDLMLAEKQSCAVIVDTDDTLIGLLTLGDIRAFGKSAKSGSKNPKEILVSELCVLNGGICSVPCTVTPDMELCHAQMIMKEHGVNQVPVVKNIYERTHPIGLLDPDSISLTYSALATRQSLS